jgi:hypothetical protein
MMRGKHFDRKIWVANGKLSHYYVIKGVCDGRRQVPSGKFRPNATAVKEGVTMIQEFLSSSACVPLPVASLSSFTGILIYKKPQSMEFGLLLYFLLVWVSVSVGMYGLFHLGRGLARIKLVERIPKALLWLALWVLALGGIGLASFSEYTGVLLALPAASCALPAGMITWRNQSKGLTVVPVGIVIFLMPLALSS